MIVSALLLEGDDDERELTLEGHDQRGPSIGREGESWAQEGEHEKRRMMTMGH